LDINGQPALHIGIGATLIALALGIVSPEQRLGLRLGAGAASQRECGGGHEHDAEPSEPAKSASARAAGSVATMLSPFSSMTATFMSA
jgi:hypothetical protein